jgi:hypothetical protein
VGTAGAGRGARIERVAGPARSLCGWGGQGGDAGFSDALIHWFGPAAQGAETCASSRARSAGGRSALRRLKAKLLESSGAAGLWRMLRDLIPEQQARIFGGAST